MRVHLLAGVSVVSSRPWPTSRPSPTSRMKTASPTEILPRHATARAFLFLFASVAVLVLAGSLKGFVPVAWGPFVWGSASTLLLVALTRVVLRSEQRRPDTVGLAIEASSVGRLSAGIAIGVALYALNVLVVLLVAGPVGVEPAAGRNAGTFALLMATLLSLAAMEEVGFRGYPLRTLAQSIGTWKAQVVVALAFGLAHIAYGWSLSAVTFGVLPSALLFGVAAMASRGLALPIGVHAGVNMASRSLGEHDAVGLWTLVVGEAARGRIAAVAPWTSAGITVLGAALLWWVYPRPRPREDRDPLRRPT